MNRDEPLFNVPAAVLAVLALLVAVHVVRLLLPEDLDNLVVIAGAFIPSRYDGDAALLPGGYPAAITSFVTHMLIHGNLMHIAFNGLWLLAFGGAIAMRVGSLRFIAFAVVTGIAAALLFLAFNLGARTPMIGASGAVAGLMGGTMRFLFSAIDSGGIWRLRETPRSVPLMSLPRTLRDSRVLVATAILIAMNLMAGAGVGMPGDGGQSIAWEAHIGGYLAGLLLFGLFDVKSPRRPELRVVDTLH
ncbi:MAG: rhomboid family intramembrane serine protease [Hyphomicrobiaceae bacterium]|nr:rhomboid family intramembrane serine protease [Hyphomicrobiaceae bacterium]